MGVGRWLGVLCMAWVLGGCGAAPPPAPRARRVVVISLDGFRHDYPDRVATPTFERLAREGARADRLIPPDPSLTFPGHASLATGVRPPRHGILANRFHDRVRGNYAYEDDPGWYEVPPLWIHTTRQGLRTHVYHWVGSGGAWQGTAPAVWYPFDKIPDDRKIDQILQWLNAPEPERPRLVMSYLAGCDHVGHEHGPDSPEVTACIAETDARLGRLLAGLAALAEPVTLLVVSDHGMTTTTGEVDPRPAFTALSPPPQVVIQGPTAHVYLAPGQDADAAAEQARALPHTRVSRPTGAERHPARTGDLVLHADFGVIYRVPKPGQSTLPGHHGGDPLHPDMGAVFFAWGAGVEAGATPEQPRAIDLVPTVCALLGIAPPEGVEGVVVPGLLGR